MDAIFELASRVSTPLALAGMFAAILFFVVRQVLAAGLFPQLTRDHSGDIIKLIIDRLFVLSLVAMVLGFAGYVVVALNQSVAPPQAPAHPPDTADASPAKATQTGAKPATKEVADTADIEPRYAFVLSNLAKLVYLPDLLPTVHPGTSVATTVKLMRAYDIAIGRTPSEGDFEGKVLPGWFQTGHALDVPGGTPFVAHYGDTYVWVMPDAVGKLSQFTLAVDGLEEEGKGQTGSYEYLDHPIIDLSKPMNDQLQLFAEDEVRIPSAEPGAKITEVWFGNHWEPYDQNRSYLVWGDSGIPVTPEFRSSGTGYAKLEIKWSKYRERRRDIRRDDGRGQAAK